MNVTKFMGLSVALAFLLTACGKQTTNPGEIDTSALFSLSQVSAKADDKKDAETVKIDEKVVAAVTVALEKSGQKYADVVEEIKVALALPNATEEEKKKRTETLKALDVRAKAALEAIKTDLLPAVKGLGVDKDSPWRAAGFADGAYVEFGKKVGGKVETVAVAEVVFVVKKGKLEGIILLIAKPKAEAKKD